MFNDWLSYNEKWKPVTEYSWLQTRTSETRTQCGLSTPTGTRDQKNGCRVIKDMIAISQAEGGQRQEHLISVVLTAPECGLALNVGTLPS